MEKKIERKPYDRDNLILYLEFCLVDNSGRIIPARMNMVDWEIMKELKGEGLIDYGRLPGTYVFSEENREKGRSAVTHWVRFVKDETWGIAHKIRRERAERICEKHSKDLTSE